MTRRVPRITAIRAWPLAVEMGEAGAFGHARGLFTTRGSILIEVESDAGISGFGEAWGAAPAATLGYLRTLEPFYVGRDIVDREGGWHAVLARMYSLRLQNQLTAVASGIDIALWDLAGQWLDLPVHRLLGGPSRESVPCYASGGYFTGDPANGLERQLAGVAGAGYPAYKIKIGRGPKDDAARAALAREAIGPDALLMVDVNGAYDAGTAWESMRRLEGLDVHWMEEPVPSDDVDGLARLGRRRLIPIATGESHMTAHEFKRLLDTGAVDVLMPDLTLCGGLGEGRTAVQLARLYGVRLSPHVWGTGIGLAAAVHYVAAMPADPHSLSSPYPTLVEYDYSESPLRDDLLEAPIRPERGLLPVPQGPGLGVTVDRAALARLAAA